MKAIKNIVLMTLGLTLANAAFANDNAKLQTVKKMYAAHIKHKPIEHFFDKTFVNLKNKAKKIPNLSHKLHPEHPDFDPYEDFGIDEICISPLCGPGDSDGIKMTDFKLDKNQRVIASGVTIPFHNKFTFAFELKCNGSQCKISDMGYYKGKFQSEKDDLIQRLKKAKIK